MNLSSQMDRLPYTYMLIFCSFTFVCIVGRAPGTNQTISANSDTSPSPKLYVVRNEAFNVGSDVNLTCSNKTWNEMMYVIWTIDMKYNPEECKIAFDTEGRSDDSCEDGKSLRNTSSAQSYLHIPNFSDYDVGVYKCESVYRRLNENYEIHVAITVPPSISAWLERKDNRMVAVCKAESGIPAANISWSHMGNSSTVETLLDSRGFYTVESLLELPEGMDTVNLSCVIRHPYWKGEKILVPELQKGYVSWLRVLIVVVIIAFLTGVLFFAQKKPVMFR
ncbi:cell surface glycoprotein CD200 receptor 1-B-like isoform X1 [Micropterus dolomieu]|uniref:cell surface glycoprotein CD200 receptor 1-B-like isoform X1 n=1 Tax=Micropterus dolomieu TaxID=147949 RepID=UPI001E8E89A9|nr:cell surface glycoprotein CD200 receptor 1-B-like isoform X1 [Micropterus dolomieu]